MDLAIGAEKVFVMVYLFAKDGKAELVTSCTHLLTGLRCAKGLYTDHALFEIGPGESGVRILETFGSTAADISARCDL